MHQMELQERLFYGTFLKFILFVRHARTIGVLFAVVLEELVSSGRLAGSISGGRQDQAQYVPSIYVRSQNEWVDNFLKQNGYLGTSCSNNSGT